MLTVICGPMFSGKTEELIRRAKRKRIANRRVRLFKQARDDRYEPERVVSHDSGVYEARPLAHLADVWRWANGGQGEWGFIGIDEFQFFDDAEATVLEILQGLSARAHVVVAGLDLDSDGRPFGPMPTALALADEVMKLTAVCRKCGRDATRSWWNPKRPKDGVVQVGAGELYEARCFPCWREKT